MIRVSVKLDARLTGFRLSHREVETQDYFSNSGLFLFDKYSMNYNRLTELVDL
jgi:hypothetical protein